MDMPFPKSMRYEILKYLKIAQPASRHDCENSLPQYKKQSIKMALEEMVKGGLIRHEPGAYSLSRFANDHFKAAEEKGPLVEPRYVNVMTGGELTNYEYNMRRNRRPDSDYSTPCYHTSGTSQTPFRGEVRK